MRCLVLLFVCLVCQSAGAQDAEAPCVDPADLRLGEVALSAPFGEVVHALGPPDSSAVGYEDDDGGVVVVATFHYGPLGIDIVRDRVDRIRTHSPEVVGPFGVRAGMAQRDAERITGAESVPGDQMDTANAEALWVSVCTGPDRTHPVDGGLEVGFDASGTAVEVALVALRP